MATATFTVSATTDWQNKFSISAGQGFTVSAKGKWCWDPNQPSVGGGGTGLDNPQHACPECSSGMLNRTDPSK